MQEHVLDNPRVGIGVGVVQGKRTRIEKIDSRIPQDCRFPFRKVRGFTAESLENRLYAMTQSYKPTGKDLRRYKQTLQVATPPAGMLTQIDDYLDRVRKTNGPVAYIIVEPANLRVVSDEDFRSNYEITTSGHARLKRPEED